MEDRKKIEERLRKKEAEIQGLEDRLRTARIYVQALHDVLKMLGTETPSPPSTAAYTESILRVGSAVDQARQVILSRKEPVHISALLEALGRDLSRESRASLTSSLAAYVRRGEIFTRPAPNTFGLVELGHTTSDDDEIETPPSGFGRQTTRSSPVKDERRSVPPARPAPSADDQDDDSPF